MPNEYDLGDLVHVTTPTPFKNVETGAALDPDHVYLSVRDPSGNVDIYEYSVDAEVTRVGTGDYESDISTDEEGTWYYRWWSTGDGQAAEENQFEVKAAFAIE
jgi:hypothetical protein